MKYAICIQGKRSNPKFNLKENNIYTVYDITDDHFQLENDKIFYLKQRFKILPISEIRKLKLTQITK